MKAKVTQIISILLFLSSMLFISCNQPKSESLALIKTDPFVLVKNNPHDAQSFVDERF